MYKRIVLQLLISALVFIAVATGQTPSPSPTPETAFGPEFKRFVDVDIFNLVTRYRYIRANNGVKLANQQQWQMAFRTRFKFDRKAKYSVVAGIFSGPQFITNWNNLGPGTGKLMTNVYVKQLFFDARPTKKIEFQVGGITVNNGENSEATGYDNDNYITGERLSIRAPKQLFFDEISATNAYLGDLTHPSIFGRLHRLNEANYHQFLFRKQVNKQVGFSADYTFASGTDTLREALRIKPKNFFLNTILFDTYQRVSTPDGYGFDIFGEKVINKYVTANGGFSRIDRRLTLNGDKFQPGKRLYGSFIVKLRPDLSLSPVFVHAVGPLPTATTHRVRFDLILTWNVLETFHRNHVL
jgi:hypothetical protein